MLGWFAALLPSRAPAVPVFMAMKFKAETEVQVPDVNDVAPTWYSNVSVCALVFCRHCSPTNETENDEIDAPVLLTNLTPKIGLIPPVLNAPKARSDELADP